MIEVSKSILMTKIKDNLLKLRENLIDTQIEQDIEYLNYIIDFIKNSLDQQKDTKQIDPYIMKNGFLFNERIKNTN